MNTGILIIGDGWYAVYMGLEVIVKLGLEGFGYEIWRKGETEPLAAHKPCWPFNDSEEGAKNAAIERAKELVESHSGDSPVKWNEIRLR